MTGRMEDGEGGGAPSEEGFPFQTCRRGLASPSSLEAFRLVGRRPGGSTVRWGWGKVRQIFYGEKSCSIKAVNRQTGLRALRAESTRRLWGRWRHS